MSNNDNEYRIASTLNRYTGNILDWNRVGELLRSNHVYNYEELIIRLKITTGTCLGTYLLGTCLSRFTTSLSNNYLSYGLGFLVSFSITHGLAIEKLVSKRLEMKAEIELLKEKIISVLNNSGDYQSSDNLDGYDGYKRHSLSDSEKEDIRNQLETILVSEAKNNASSATLGMRKRLLLDLLNRIRTSNTITDTCSSSSDSSDSTNSSL